ncbi:MAG: ATP-grasp domain-containing protein [Lachnospiraceae bacterium]|nr:ATP-grasp domain-containing protein [Lachnospiraceae bacterium]
MNFVFISPNFPTDYAQFCVGLKENGANVLGIGDAPYDELRDDLKWALTEYYRVDSLENYDEMIRAVGYFTGRYGKMDWIESNNEYWLELDAALRTDFNVLTGLKSDEIGRFRSKSGMKERYEAAGVPTARWQLVSTIEKALEFIDTVGYPVVVKPDRGVGAEATYKLKCEADVKNFFDYLPSIPYVMEEFVKGSVTTFDGIVNSQGKVLFAASHITENSIMDMLNEGVPCWYYVDKEVPDDVRDAGERTLAAFDVRSRAFHLEFFRLTEAKEGLGEVGDIVGLEVNMRPAGGFTPEMINIGQSADMFRIWSDMIVFDEQRHVYNGPKRYSLYIGRRDNAVYTYSGEDLWRMHGENIYRAGEMPPAIGRLMGNDYMLALFDTKEEMKAFVKDAYAPMRVL